MFDKQFSANFTSRIAGYMANVPYLKGCSNTNF